MLLLIVALGIIGLMWSRNEYQDITREIQNLTRENVTLLAQIISQGIIQFGEVNLDKINLPETSRAANLMAVFIDYHGDLYELTPGVINPDNTEIFMELFEEYQDIDYSYAVIDSVRFQSASAYAIAPVINSKNQVIGKICLIVPISHLEAYNTRLWWLLLTVIALVTLIGIGASVILTRYFSKHFTQAQTLSALVANGDYHLRIPEKGPTELKDLAHHLNLMAERLQEQLDTRKKLLANITHELARPLAGLSLGIQSLRKGAIKDPNLADDLLVSMDLTIRRFESLIDDITLAAHPETSPIELHFSELVIESFLKSITTRYWSLAESRNLKLVTQIEEGLLPLFVDEKRLNQIIGNLMDNAIKFTPPGKTIHINANFQNENHLCISIIDGGSGLSEEEIDHIFEPFYQGNAGRRVKQGMGLGLSIAQQLTTALNGELTLQNYPGGGTIANLILPIGHP